MLWLFLLGGLFEGVSCGARSTAFRLLSRRLLGLFWLGGLITCILIALVLVLLRLAILRFVFDLLSGFGLRRFFLLAFGVVFLLLSLSEILLGGCRVRLLLSHLLVCVRRIFVSSFYLLYCGSFLVLILLFLALDGLLTLDFLFLLAVRHHFL